MQYISRFLLGIDPDKYDLIREDINKSNRRVLIGLSSLSTSFLVVLGILSLLISEAFLSPWFYFLCASVSAIVLIISLSIKDTHSQTIFLGTVLYMLAILSFGLLFGIYDSPDSTSTVFVALLISVPLLFITRPVITDVIIVFMIVVFVLAEVNVKNTEAFLSDTINAITFGIISILVSSFMMRIKLAKIYSEHQNDVLVDLVQQESIVDDMTGLGNRKGYENNFSKYPYVSKGRDFVYVSIDLNGLKVANDTKGHAAGDELIKGAADCMKQVFEKYGNLYRVGGDEFVAALFVDKVTFESLHNKFLNVVDEWRGEVVDSLSVAVGYACSSDYPGESVDALSKIADKHMYADKGRHYKNKGDDRRGRQEAHTVLIDLYTKILKIDLTQDIFQPIRYDPSEMVEEKGYSESISSWLHDFASSGYVHPDDRDDYIRKTSLEYMREYFSKGNRVLSIMYRRKYGDDYKKVIMEIVPVDTYSDYNEQAFLYVKQIEK